MFDDGYDDGYVDEVVGMDMMDNGMMRYEEGVILTEMGMPGLGMAEMQMGQMQMAQGEVLYDAGMMQGGMGMGYGVGYGGGVGLLAAQQALLMAQTAYVCMGIGCTYPCCVRRCAPGCMLPCCRKQVFVVNSQQYNKPVVYAQQQQQVYQNQSQQINQQLYAQNQGYNQQVVKPIFAGSLYRQQHFTWHFTPNAMVTIQHFINEPLSTIFKLKVKKQILHNDCYFLKTSHINSTDNYYSVPRHQQLNWFCSIIWAKLQLQRYGCDLYHQFNGFIEGRILRKSRYLGQWAFRQVVIDAQGLKSYKTRNEMPTTRIHRIPELWTRFELIEQQMYLVVKLHFEGVKYEYGVPLNDAIHWIRAFFYLMR